MGTEHDDCDKVGFQDVDVDLEEDPAKDETSSPPMSSSALPLRPLRLVNGRRHSRETSLGQLDEENQGLLYDELELRSIDASHKKKREATRLVLVSRRGANSPLPALEPNVFPFFITRSAPA